ncbi:phosphatase PAP2 family protein [Flagellimonas sp. DF-77]|uniref:phosphatase PAP2 family protein n=1 Tax=Flagellimonas algarum TaxID=3230298 RepID=UPI00339AB4D8
MIETLVRWDHELFIYMNGLGSEPYDRFWIFLTQIRSWTPLFVLFIVLFMLKFPKRRAMISIGSVLSLVAFITLLTHLVKDFVGRLRPNNDPALSDLIRVLQHPNDYSFFSGHAASSFAITTLVILLMRDRLKWSWWFLVWPVLFAYSRIYVGVHFPLDIVVGMLVGVVTGYWFFKMTKRFIAPDSSSTHRV